jgi:dephospho-CoA kinase
VTGRTRRLASGRGNGVRLDVVTAIVGLTGGIASGKSSVASILRAEGVVIVDADEVAREVVAKGSPGLSAVVEAFGPHILGPGGELDRKALGARVFADAEARRQLEAITHPRIFARSMEKLGAVAASGAPYGMYDAALLVENGSHRMMQALVVVAAPRALQRARIVARDGLTEAEADARIDAQLPLEQKIAVADHVIWNDADLGTLRARTLDVHRRLTEQFA